MASILICAPDPLTDDLHDTILWRDGNERHVVTSFQDALLMAVAVRPALIVIDRDLPRSLRLVEDLRGDATVHHVSIAIAARGDISDLEIQLLQSGANAVIRLPAWHECDERLGELMQVPARRAARLPARLEFSSTRAPIPFRFDLLPTSLTPSHD